MGHDSKTTVAVVQMTSTADVEANMDAAEASVDNAASRGAKLVVLPECFFYLGPEEAKLELAEDLGGGGPIMTRCKTLASRHGVELVLGGFWERSDRPTHVYNSCVHLDASGAIHSVYRKIHLFDVDLPDGTKVVESETVVPGDQVVVTDTPFGALGLSVCYDVRFPELYRQLVDKGAIALAVPAAFTATTGRDHWHILLAARAIEQQSYVLAAAQVGHHFGKRHSYGHAMIVDPWGKILAECEDDDTLAIAQIDPAEVARVRAILPSLKHRRL